MDARNLDWQAFVATLDELARAILQCIADERPLLEVAHAVGMSRSTIQGPSVPGAGQIAFADLLAEGLRPSEKAVGQQLDLKTNGTLVGWGDNSYGQINTSGISNVMAIAAGWIHSATLKNDGTVVAWGYNQSGQSSVPTPLTNVTSNAPVKMLGAGGFQTVAGVFSPVTQYQVDVKKDVLLIYNTNSIDSLNVCAYYTNYRPMIASANVLGVGCSNKTETFYPSEYTNLFLPQVTSWLTTNATKRPQYVVLFLDVPSRVNTNGDYSVNDREHIPPTSLPVRESVQHQLSAWAQAGWQPFVTHINMGASNDCVRYIDKMTNYTSQGVVLSASAAAYGNIHYYFDDAGQLPTPPATYQVLATNGVTGVLQNGVSTNDYTYEPTNGTFILSGANVAGYWSWGRWGFQSPYYYLSNHFSGSSSWYIMGTAESYNGQRANAGAYQGTFLQWFSSNAFGGTAYSSTPIAAVTHVDEPGTALLEDTQIYFGLWAAGKSFAICAWNSKLTSQFQAVGDPLVKR